MIWVPFGTHLGTKKNTGTGTLALLSTSKIGRTDPVLSPAIYRFLVHAVDVALPFELAASYHSASDYCVGANPVLRKV